MQIFEKAKITDKNQLTIPKRVREQLGVGKGDYVSFYIGDDGLVKVSNPENLKITPKNKNKLSTVQKGEKQNG